MSDKLKAVFLGASPMGRQKLAKMLAARTEETRREIEAARLGAGRLADQHVDKARLLADADALEQSVAAAQPPGTPVADGYRACGPLRDQAASLRKRADDAAAQRAGTDAKGRLKLVEMNITAAKRAVLLTANEAAAVGPGAAIASQEQQHAVLAKMMPPDEAGVDKLLEQAVATREQAEAAIGTPAAAGSERAASRARVAELGGIAGLGPLLQPTRRDERHRRNAAEESAARLNVFDQYFAEPDTTPDARRENQAMRTAAVIRSAASQQARTVNDPALAGRVGSLMVKEYGTQLKQDEAGLKLTTALVIDDPVEKLLTGKLRIEDAIGRVRDQAEMGGVEPSKMLDLLIRQAEMRFGSLDPAADIAGAVLPNDGTQVFYLADLEGELDQRTADALLGPNGPVLGAAGLQFTPEVTEQLGTMRKVLQAWDSTAAAPAKPRRRAPAKPLPDVPAKAVASADAIPGDPADGAAASPVPPPPPSGPGRTGTTGGGVTGDMLRAGADALVSPANRHAVTGYKTDATNRRIASPDGTFETETKAIRAAAYVPAPGLRQDHRVDPSLEEAGNGDQRDGALDGRQYAHLRMLQRADEEDRQTPFTISYVDPGGQKSFTGTPEEIVYDYFRRVYKQDAPKTEALLRRVAEAFQTVPLTVTFTAASLFSADKDEPAHGSAYSSDVVYTRGKTDAASLVGSSGKSDVVPEKYARTQGSLEALRKALAKLDAPGAAPPPDLPAKRQKLVDEIAKLTVALAGMDSRQAPTLGVTGGNGGAERGANYQRWRLDKDRREGRLDGAMGTGQAQIFGAVNPGFADAKGTDAGNTHKGDTGVNYYGNAHFKLRNSVRSRAAFAVRGAAMSVGGGASTVQRTDLMLMLCDMIRGGGSNLRYIDSILNLAVGGAKSLATGTDWEIHIYGGFDPVKDAEEIYLSPKVEDPYRTRIRNFATTNGLKVVEVPADGATATIDTAPVRHKVSEVAGGMVEYDKTVTELGAMNPN